NSAPAPKEMTSSCSHCAGMLEVVQNLYLLPAPLFFISAEERESVSERIRMLTCHTCLKSTPVIQDFFRLTEHSQPFPMQERGEERG
ncbi:hypothetical protein KUCAC02_005805, partial [Chaenocephalus aceratus]